MSPTGFSRKIFAFPEKAWNALARSRAWLLFPLERAARMRASCYVAERRSRVAHSTCSLPLLPPGRRPHQLTFGGHLLGHAGPREVGGAVKPDARRTGKLLPL